LSYYNVELKKITNNESYDVKRFMKWERWYVRSASESTKFREGAVTLAPNQDLLEKLNNAGYKNISTITWNLLFLMWHKRFVENMPC